MQSHTKKLSAATGTSLKTAAVLLLVVAQSVVLATCVLAQGSGFTRYIDPEQRFSFEYPSTMKVRAAGNDEVRVIHPGATLRIMVLVEKRRRPGNASADPLLDAFKKTLKEEMKDVAVLEEGKLAGLQGAQGYVVCSFKDLRGIRLVQLVQYYVTEDSLLQMTISDKPEGFKNLEKVVRKIHQSLRILKPKLK
jgi:hypothetical protein